MVLYIFFNGIPDLKVLSHFAGDPGSSPGSGRFPGDGHVNPLQYPCLENPVDRGAWETGSMWSQESDTTEATEHPSHRAAKTEN